MNEAFTRLTAIAAPTRVSCGDDGTNESFEITVEADGAVPFPQIIVHHGGRFHLIKGDDLRRENETRFAATVPAGLAEPGEITLQIEGCRTADLAAARGEDWIKEFRTVTIETPAAQPPETPAPSPVIEQVVAVPAPAQTSGSSATKVYFGIHKHMHQPYYNTTDKQHWDGQLDEIFGSRCGPYTHFIPAAVRQYIGGGLPHAGLSTSWSGSLIEQLDRAGADGLCGGCFADWKRELRAVAAETTALGNPRVDFSGFGFFHPLMALIPARDIVKQIEWHRGIIESAFGIPASRVLFPPETAFHVRMIPALKAAGIEAVIYDSIHRFRSCKDYPYAGVGEGMLPPNRAEQENPAVNDWMQLHNIWAGSKIAPSLLRPEYVCYTDPEGETHSIIAVPAERYIGNEDARGGFGALQYPDVLGQVYDQIAKTGAFDPAHPPFFLLHSDGDNHGGGAESYYTHNTGQLVEWAKQDERFEFTTIRDYLQRFPPDPANAVHLEPGSWSGADNGDPQFRKWFSRYTESYSPDLNSWAVLTALQNAVHTLEDSDPGHAALGEAQRLLLVAETSCYWYWTGQDVWDSQVTNAANAVYAMIGSAVDAIAQNGGDSTAPTIFAPWITPENPGGQTWGDHGLVDAGRTATLHTFIHDISGVQRACLILRTGGKERMLDLECQGLYPSRTGAAVTAGYYTCQLPVGLGDVRYFIEAEDRKGNTARSALERVFLA